MGQYHPDNRVGEPQTDDSGRQSTSFAEIDHRPTRDELNQAYQLARQAGLWRFDKEAPM